MCPQNIHYVCTASNILSAVFAAATVVVASGFLPLISPAWDAKRTIRHYCYHEKGIQAGAMLLFVVGMTYLAMMAVMPA